MSIQTEYSAVFTEARATQKAGFKLAVSVAILFDANRRLPAHKDAAVFVCQRTRAYLPASFYTYRAPEAALRGFFADRLGADFKKATMSRGFSNGRTLAMKRAAWLSALCDVPEGRNAPWAARDKVEAVIAALAADGITSETQLLASFAGEAASVREKTPAEKGAAALATFLKHADGNAALITLAMSALETFVSGNKARHAEIMVALAGTAPQAPADVTDDIPLGIPGEMAQAA